MTFMTFVWLLPTVQHVNDHIIKITKHRTSNVHHSMFHNTHHRLQDDAVAGFTIVNLCISLDKFYLNCSQCCTVVQCIQPVDAAEDRREL